MRVGELGGNTLGYYGARFGPGGKFILGHSFQGAFHLWVKTEVCGMLIYFLYIIQAHKTICDLYLLLQLH
jgi:hypothetical protein